MKRIGLIISCLFLLTSINAEDKLDILDKQSKEFFKAITGLEKDYLEGQIKDIKDKTVKKRNVDPVVNPIVNIPPANEVTEEEFAKNVFEHENEMARLTTDFTKTKKLKDIKIKSMYSFNGKNYVVLKLGESTSNQDKELSLDIEGRYTRGDVILTHKIININTRTKTVQMYKKLDDEYGYSIYLSNYGISVSDLIKKPKMTNEKENKVNIIPTVKDTFLSIEKKSVKENKVKLSECLYTVNVNNLNVRNASSLDARVLRILKKNDQFTVKNKRGNWLKIDTIYKKISGDVMDVDKENNWLQIADNNVSVNEKNCL